MAILSNINGKFAVESTGAIQFNGSNGTAGYILKSNGNASPTWVAASTVIGGPYLPLTGGTLSGATATASGISFTVGGALTGTSATFSGTLTVGGNNVVGFSGSWNGADMPGSRWNGYTVNGGEIVFQRDNPNSGQMSILVDGGYYAGENNGFYSLYSSSSYNSKAGFYADTSGVLQFNAPATFTGLVSGITPTASANFVTKAYADGLTPGAGVFLPLAGGTLTGSLTITGGTAYGLNITTSGTQETIKIDRAETNDNAITKYQTASADKWIVGLRNTGDDNFRFYSYGTSSDVLTIDQANANATFGGIVGMGSTGIYAGTSAQLNLPGRGLAIKNDKNGSNNNWSYIENTATGSSSNINFYTGNNAAALTLAHNGNATFTGAITISKTSSADLRLHSSTYSADFNLISGATGANKLGIYDNNGGAYRFLIDSSGNVGIGTQSPSDKLQIVQGHSILVGDYFQLGSGSSDIMGALGWNRDTTNGVIYNTSFGAFQMHNNQGKLCLQGYNANGANQFQHEFYNNGNIYFVGNVGIGVTSPTTKLHVSSANAVVTIEATTNGQNCSTWYKANGNNQWETGCNIAAGTDYQIYDRLNSASRMVVGHDGDVTIPGNVGIGTTGPNAKLHVFGGSANTELKVTTNDNYIARIGMYEEEAGASHGGFIQYRGELSDRLEFGSKNSGTDTVHMSISDSYGNVGIGTAPNAGVAGDRLKIQGGNNGLGCIAAISGQYSYGVRIEGSNLSTQLALYTSSTSQTTQINFEVAGNSSAGKITTTTNTTTYTTSSDYRLKENVIPISDSIFRLNQLKPSRFNFIGESNKTVDGFLAHEVQDVVPEAIVGEKDEIDKDGNPVHQGIDQAKLVPLLVAAIQELEARVKELENK